MNFKVLKDSHGNVVQLLSGKIEDMQVVDTNSTGASLEKHVPTYHICDEKIMAQVNHVMESEHYIEWIGYVTLDRQEIVFLSPGKEAFACFDYIPGGILYAYCNQHGLWKEEVLG